MRKCINATLTPTSIYISVEPEYLTSMLFLVTDLAEILSKSIIFMR